MARSDPNQTTVPFFVDIVTRSIVDPDEPPRRDKINYHSREAREGWLMKYMWWSLHNGYSVTVSPATED